jgi:hypothetical protein
MTTYQLYQLGKSDSVASVLAEYERKYGRPPQILEVSPQFDLPEGLTLVVSRTRLPSNIMLLGMIEDENNQS